MKEYFVYILLCKDRSFYTGVTHNLSNRIVQHQEGSDPFSYTFSRRPVQLVYWSSFPNIITAIEWEKKIQGWTRKKKIALIQGGIEEVMKLKINPSTRRKPARSG